MSGCSVTLHLLQTLKYAVDGIVIDGGGEIIPPGGGEPPPEDDGDNIGIRSTLGDEELAVDDKLQTLLPW